MRTFDDVALSAILGVISPDDVQEWAKTEAQRPDCDPRVRELTAYRAARNPALIEALFRTQYPAFHPADERWAGMLKAILARQISALLDRQLSPESFVSSSAGSKPSASTKRVGASRRQTQLRIPRGSASCGTRAIGATRPGR